MNKDTYIKILKGVTLFSAGALTGALVANGVLRSKYERLAEEEIASVKATYKKSSFGDANSSFDEEKQYARLVELVDEAQTYECTLQELGYTVTPQDIARLNDHLKGNIVATNTNLSSDDAEDDQDEYDQDEYDQDEDDPEEDPTDKTVNVFEASKDGRPYIITWEQFFDEKDNYDKLNLDYYAGDNTLADTNDAPIPDVVALVGPDALDNFGLGSHEENVVYVRNDKLAIDFEIVRKDISYSVYVLGNVEERPRIGRMRENYDG